MVYTLSTTGGGTEYTLSTVYTQLSGQRRHVDVSAPVSRSVHGASRSSQAQLY